MALLAETVNNAGKDTTIIWTKKFVVLNGVLKKRLFYFNYTRRWAIDGPRLHELSQGDQIIVSKIISIHCLGKESGWSMNFKNVATLKS